MRINKYHIICFFMGCVFLKVASLTAQENYSFEHIELPVAFLDSPANCILEDSKGFMWFGFSNGLVKYDGYKGKTVLRIMESGNAIGFGAVSSLLEDNNGNIWIGSSKGVYIYNTLTETSVYLNDSRLGDNPCRSLSLKANGEILIGTRRGLFVYNLKGEFLEQYIHQEGITNSLSNNIIRSTYEDTDGNIWIGTYDKLNVLNREQNKLDHFRLQKVDSLYRNNNLILSIKPLQKDNDSILIVGTETGLCFFNRYSQNFTQYSHFEEKNSISNSVVKSMYVVDKQLWLGTDLGLNTFDLGTGTFANYYHNFNNSRSISSNVVNAIYFDTNRNLWIATDSGIDKIYLNATNVLLNKFGKSDALFKEGTVINGFTEQDDGTIWIATQQGAFRFDKKQNKYEQFLPPKILHNKVRDIYADKEGFVWIATSGGLNVYNSKTKSFSSYVSRSGNKDLKSNYISSIAQDAKGTTWIGTENRGLFKIVKKANGALEFINFRHKINDTNSLSSNTIYDLAFDENDNAWIATDKGVNCFFTINGTIERFQDTLKYPDVPDRLVNHLSFDQDKNLYLSTYQGLYQFNPTSGKFNHYKGLPQNITSAVALGSKLFLVSGRKLYTYDKSNRELIKIPNREIGLQFLKKIEIFRDQRILLYGRTGFSVVDADELTIKNGNVDLRWTNFSISNTEINPHTEYNSRYVLTKNIDETDEIELQYNENSFRIEFSALPYNSYRDIEYRYILENYEENWNTLRNGENYVSYTQTRPGKYLLKVQASDDQGRFKGEERVLSLIVQPPLYMSKWALILYLLCFVLLILFYRRILLNRERDRNELLVEKLEHQKSEELIALKTRFFTNITHELKTPLTLISSPIDDLLTKPLDEKTQKSLTLVKRNADRLKKLVNQILDIRKIEAGGEKLRIQNYDIVKFCNQIKNQFKDESLKRNIFLQFSSEHASKMMWFDIEKVEKILFNLLSNAFKFTPDKGTIRVSVDEGSNEEQDSDYIFISVSDTGKGISKEDQANIFDRFNSLSSSNYTNQKGTGIGLSLIYEYTALHGGVVKFDSVLGVGSKFVFTLPKDKSFLNNYEVIETTLEEEPNKEMVEFEKLVSLDENRSETEKEEDVIVKVLIVEDDPDMRDFLISGFSSEYSVVEAEDGKEGLKKAIKELPDIIVSDLMMPNLDGIAFCKKLKADFRTSHIPFILLTAKGDMESKLIGLETGADDYIQKPFNLEHLMVRVKGLISQRESLRKKYLQQVKLEPGEITVNSLDEKFLDELLAKIESEMDNSDLSVKLLSEMLGISPANLYRKIKALTGETATEFIRNIRLKRAAQLLKNKHLNVSEVMYMVGFTHHSYFARSFKELFGVSPKSYGS